MRWTFGPLGTALTYLAVGVLWIIFSDVVARNMAGSGGATAWLQTIKGFAFVVVTGAVLYVLLRRRDVATARFRDSLRERDALIRHVASAGPVVIYRMELHAGRWVPTWVSGGVERLLGYTRAEVLEPGWWFAGLHPEDRTDALQVMEVLDPGATVAHEYRFRTKDGAYRWIRDVLYLADGQRGPVEVLGAWLDVTEQHELQRALEERERFYRSLIENAADSMLVLDAEGTVHFASRSVEAHTGQLPETLVGGRAFDLIHPEDHGRVQHAFARATSHPGEVVAAEYRIRHADGTWRHISSVGHSLPGDPPRIVVNSRDLTEARAVEEQFRQAQKVEAVGQLTAGIVHDFNNVLSVVLGNAELLLSELPPELAEQRQDVAHIRRAAQGGADMVRKLLGFSRHAALRIAPLDIAEVLADVRAMLLRILPPTIRVSIDAQGPLPPVWADAGAVQQILLNLATNARDAMPDGGHLTITVVLEHLETPDVDRPWAVPGDYVRVAVTDTGMGMDAATQARAFDPFFTTKPPGKGTGLGMPMILGLVKQHGGIVDLTSEPGRGTTVGILLPATSADTAPEGPVAVHEARGGSETILLVDDEPALLRTGKRILEKFGYGVETAANGAQGLRLLEERAAAIDLVVSDVQMPELTGIQFYRELRRRRLDIPFLFSSGEVAGQFQQEHGLADVAYVQKPWTVEEVVRAVRAALDAGPRARS